MKVYKTLLLVSIILCSVHEIYAQPGESDKKYNIHEINLYEREDGTKAGAIAWFTASPDSIQKFVIRGLSIMEPVQVLLQALSPDEEVTLQFVKEKWSEPESSISAKGKKIGKKMFRTYKTAAMKISAKKAGIPYMILVQVGKKLPINRAPLFKITNDKDEYENYLKNKGKTSGNKPDSDVAVIPVTKNENGGGDSSSNSSLLYIIIGLLTLMVLLLGYFVFAKKGGKKILMIIFLLGLGINSSWSQEAGPIQIPPNDTEQPPFPNGYMTQIELIFEMLSKQAVRLSSLEDRHDLLSTKLNDHENWASEGFGRLLEALQHGDDILAGTVASTYSDYMDLKNEFNAFKNEFGDNMPGEDTEGGNRIVREADLNLLRDRIRSLEAQVEYLSLRDRNYAPEEEDYENEEVVYCLGDPACVEAVKICGRNLLHDMGDVKESFRKLNRIAKHGDWVAESGIAQGNAIANSATGMGLGWQPQLNKIQAARRSLWRTYHAKYNELVERMSGVLDQFESCMNNTDAEYDRDHLRNGGVNWLESNAPELLTPMM